MTTEILLLSALTQAVGFQASIQQLHCRRHPALADDAILSCKDIDRAVLKGREQRKAAGPIWNTQYAHLWTEAECAQERKACRGSRMAASEDEPLSTSSSGSSSDGDAEKQAHLTSTDFLLPEHSSLPWPDVQPALFNLSELHEPI